MDWIEEMVEESRKKDMSKRISKHFGNIAENHGRKKDCGCVFSGCSLNGGSIPHYQDPEVTARRFLDGKR